MSTHSFSPSLERLSPSSIAWQHMVVEKMRTKIRSSTRIRDSQNGWGVSVCAGGWLAGSVDRWVGGKRGWMKSGGRVKG